MRIVTTWSKGAAALPRGVSAVNSEKTIMNMINGPRTPLRRPEVEGSLLKIPRLLFR